MRHSIMRASVAAAAFMLTLGAAATARAQVEETLEQKAARIHREAIVIDLHSDVTPKIESGWDFSERHELNVEGAGGRGRIGERRGGVRGERRGGVAGGGAGERGAVAGERGQRQGRQNRPGHMDMPRMREGGLDAQFFSLYMGRTPGDGTAVKRAIKRIDAVHQAVRKWPDQIALATTAADIRRIVGEGKIAALMGVEGGHIIENEIPVLRMYHALGVRYMTLTHSFNTDWADAAGVGSDTEGAHGGLTDLGRDIVREMNYLGMMVDISHVADTTFWDALEVSQAPMIASHSSCRDIADHRRNMTDEMIEALAAKGGVIHINFATGFINPGNSAGATARHVVDHFDHAIRLVGAAHVGIGADWDGTSIPADVGDVTWLPTLTLELLKRGHGEEDIKMALGGSTLRVMAEVEAVAARLQAEERARNRGN